MNLFRKLERRHSYIKLPFIKDSLEDCTENKIEYDTDTIAQPNKLSCYYIGRNTGSARISYSDAQKLLFRDPNMKIREVVIQKFPNLIDISVLNNVRHIRIDLCHSLTDVSPLAQTDTVLLHCCNGITDVNVLKSVAHLTFIDCKNIRSVDELNLVSSLTLNKCHQIQSVPEFKSAKLVSLWECDGINTVDNIGNVETLKLGVKLTALPNLAEVDFLHLSKIPGMMIKDFSPLQQLQGLYLHGFDVDLEMSHNFVNIRYLTLSHCAATFAPNTTNNLRKLKTISPGCQVKFHSLPKLRHLQLGENDYSNWDFSLLRLKTLIVERRSIKRFRGLMPRPNMFAETEFCTISHIKQLAELTKSEIMTCDKVQYTITIYPRMIRDLLTQYDVSSVCADVQM